MKCLELFTGAGGLAMGIGGAGFSHAALVEFNHDACETMRFNKALAGSPLKKWRIIESDVRAIADFGAEFKNISMVAGGPPCQPFSMGGKAAGPADPRDMFPEAVRAVRQLQPKAFIFENVKGLLREKFSAYFEYIILQMTYPSVIRRPTENVADHHARLERLHTSGAEPEYRVVWQLLNAANYGVPQKRERVFMVGFRADVHVAWSFPKATHSKAALEQQKKSGEYFARHNISPREQGKYQLSLLNDGEITAASLKPWRTVRDAIGDLPDPEKDPAPEMNHVAIAGARSYPGHTGSPIDEPAKTLKAGDHGVPGGENMLRFSNGKFRYFTLRESARLQTFPDYYRFNGSWSESMRQLGNAVPVKLGETVARSVRAALLNV